MPSNAGRCLSLFTRRFPELTSGSLWPSSGVPVSLIRQHFPSPVGSRWPNFWPQRDTQIPYNGANAPHLMRDPGNFAFDVRKSVTISSNTPAGLENAADEKKRVLSGMRPTGKLLLGNYMGALHNWVGLQDKYECYFFIADYHALTTDYADPSSVKQNTLEVAMDFLAAGLDPEKTAIFVQSHVVQHAELHLLLSMITSLGWLERVPSYKEQQENIVGKDLTTYGFLGYPLIQSADILVYQAHFVPVGQDQAAHVELTREIARRFNQFYRRPKKTMDPPPRKGEMRPPPGYVDTKRIILPEPEALLTPSPKLLGTDGRKMSKSYGNFILLSEPEADIRKKLKSMVTDPA